MGAALLRDDGLWRPAPGLLAYDRDWQRPAATEERAWTEMARAGAPEGIDYLGLPWATLIDGLRNDAAAVWPLLAALERIRRHHPLAPGRRRATVAQHIHADRFVPYLKAAGVTDLLWTHATVERTRIGGLRVHPFPLYPAQTADLGPPADLHRPRRWLANFIGAYAPGLYLSDVRAQIFEAAGRSPDLRILRRDAWHFNRAVYDEQIRGAHPDPAQIRAEAERKREYLEAIRESAFTLCPTGSGPNSIRIGEALALGSIPIVLTRNLRLPGPAELWQAACLIETDSTEGYQRALIRARAMDAAELRRRQTATQALYARIRPDAWGRLIGELL